MDNAGRPAPLVIPPGFEADVQKLAKLQEEVRRDPSVNRDRVALAESILQRLQHDQAPPFRAAVLVALGEAYRESPVGNRADNLQKAIACYDKALHFFTPEAAPFAYAATQTNLGNAFFQLPTGDRAANLRKAIACYEQVLRVLTPKAHYLECAKAQTNLGNAYVQLPTGDRAANLRKAIECYEQALRVFTPEAAPFEYAKAQANLGNAYCELPVGDRADNLRKAIACYEQALRFLTPEAAPFDYAATQTNLGAAYAALPVGDRAANLRKAITCYEQAFRFRTPEAAPFDYARTQHGLGDAYRALPVGDRAENLRQGIACYEQALRFLTPEAAPFEYARTQHSLGAAFVALPVGNRADNLRKAIACYEQALRFRTPEAAPFDYAATQTNLGAAYADLPVGDRAANLCKAIACYEQALRFRTPEAAPFDYAATQTNLGNAYLQLPIGDRTANLYKTIACYEQVLRLLIPEAAPFEYAKAQANMANAYCELPVGVGDRADNLRKAIACYEQALRFRTPEAAPFEYARTQHSLGNAYRELPVGDLAANLRKAITCCEQALRFLTPEAAPDGCRRAALGLGYLYFRESQWTQAQASYNTAIKATDALYKLAATEVSRQAELAEVRDLFSNLAFCLARRGKPNEAVEQLEAGKARGLAEALARDRAALDRVEAEDRKTFEEACSRIRSLEAEARAMGLAEGSEYTTSRSFAEISEDLRAARHDLYSVIDRIRAYQPEFMSPGLDFEAIVAAVATDCPLVYLITTSQGSLALIVPPGTKTLDTDHVVWLDELRSGELDGLLFERSAEGKAIGGYVVGQVLGEYQQLQAGLDRALPILSDRLVGPLAARLVELGFRRASLVPGGLLSLLPLHAAGFDAVTFIYTPSARALQAARAAARERAKRAPMLLGIGNPLPNPRPLAFARTEVEEIAPRFAPEALRLLFERDATQAAVAKSLPGTSHLHFSCHGTFNVREPLDSALYLSGADTLTLRELLDGDLDLSAARLAVLSACQTGIVDFNKVPDEAIGFPAGFLQAGVPGVVSTLWPVSDISTAILMSRFYFEHLGNGLDPASALHRAQDWLRTATARDMSLADRYERRYQEGDGKALQLWRYYRDNPEVRPFAHPYYWAAFTFTGVA